MGVQHVHQWTTRVLVDDYVPGIPAYVQACLCGALKPVVPAAAAVA